MKVEQEGIIMEIFRGPLFKVSLPEINHEVIAHPSGKIRKNRISLSVGDRVRIEMDPYDLSKGRILRRL